MDMIVNGKNLILDGELNKKQILVNNIFCFLSQSEKYDSITINVEDIKITNKFFTEINKLMKSYNYIFRDLKKNGLVFTMVYDCVKFPEQYSKCSCGKVAEISKFEEHVKMFEGEHKLMENEKNVY